MTLIVNRKLAFFLNSWCAIKYKVFFVLCNNNG